jgi:two-component system, NtrC family, response regulator HydG
MDQQIRVLVVDDDEPHAAAVAESLERVGYDCVVATSGAEGLRLIEEQVFDIVITDLIMEGVGGLEVLAKAKRELPDAEVVILTGHSTIKTAVTAMQAGASTYLTKPLDINELRTKADKASQSQRLQRSNIELQMQLNEKFGFEGVIGNSSAMHSVVSKLRQIAPTSASVLITGESGTGKELAAKALHINSPRKNKPFVPLNCAELSENVLESELFGHVKGAFTGADRDRVGRFQYANGGTLFLDEIGDMPISIQVKLLRVLESGKLPPLRERREDIPLLIEHFLKEFTASHGKTITAVTPAVRKAIMAYSWPGNVRELRNTIESMVVLDSDGQLDLDDMTEDLQAFTSSAKGDGTSGVDSLVGQSLEEIDKHYILETLKRCNGNREEAARQLGIGERTLYRKLKEYNLG